MMEDPDLNILPTHPQASYVAKKKRPWRIPRMGITDSCVYVAPARKRCECGRCAPCIENARWERIFQEKFADPNYYVKAPIRHASSLHGS